MKSKWIRILLKCAAALVLVVILLLVVSLRPVDFRDYRETDYYRTTLQELTALRRTPAVKAGLSVGVARADITPPVGVPLAGYGARKGAPLTGIHDRLYARIIAIRSGDKLACIIGCDALLLNPPVARRIEDKARSKLSLNADQLLFTATHTHSGPGGWGERWIDRQFAGPFDARVVHILVDSTLSALSRALTNLRPAGYYSGVVDAPEYVRNRLVGEKGRVDPELVYVAFTHGDKTTALFATYSAHGTVLPANNMLISGDYPGYFERELETVIEGPVIMAAAGLGSHSHRGEGEGFEKAAFIGHGLADRLVGQLKNERERRETALDIFRVPVELPPFQVRVNEKIRLAPWLARRILGRPTAYIQVLSLDETIVLGSPGEFSGELALLLKDHARKSGKTITVTSFNGCYIGYVTPSEYYNPYSYETGLMSWFGPYTGDYLTDVMMRILDSRFELY